MNNDEFKKELERFAESVEMRIGRVVASIPPIYDAVGGDGQAGVHAAHTSSDTSRVMPFHIGVRSQSVTIRPGRVFWWFHRPNEYYGGGPGYRLVDEVGLDSGALPPDGVELFYVELLRSPVDYGRQDTFDVQIKSLIASDIESAIAASYSDNAFTFRQLIGCVTKSGNVVQFNRGDMYFRDDPSPGTCMIWMFSPYEIPAGWEIVSDVSGYFLLGATSGAGETSEGTARHSHGVNDPGHGHAIPDHHHYFHIPSHSHSFSIGKHAHGMVHRHEVLISYNQLVKSGDDREIPVYGRTGYPIDDWGAEKLYTDESEWLGGNTSSWEYTGWTHPFVSLSTVNAQSGISVNEAECLPPSVKVIVIRKL